MQLKPHLNSFSFMALHYLIATAIHWSQYPLKMLGNFISIFELANLKPMNNGIICTLENFLIMYIRLFSSHSKTCNGLRGNLVSDRVLIDSNLSTILVCILLRFGVMRRTKPLFFRVRYISCEACTGLTKCSML